MRVTYYALKPVLVGEDVRQAGDLIPEANDWPYLSGYVQDGTVAPVLVVTLPQEVQDLLAEWLADRDGTTAPTPVVEGESKDVTEPVQETVPAEPPAPTDTVTEPEAKVVSVPKAPKGDGKDKR